MAQEPEPGQRVNFYSREKEAALGASLAKDLRQRTTPLASDMVRTFVERMGANLAKHQPGVRFPYQFTVITDDLGGHTHEPISFPGSYIFIPARLILETQEEAEFAGMLGHAIAHVAERHFTREATRGEIANYGPVPLIFMGSWTGMGDNNQTLLPEAFLPIQRRYEREADLLALKIASDAGYDPAGLLRYIVRQQAPDTERSKMHSSLPPKEERIAQIEKAIQLLPTKVYSVSDEFFAIQEETRRLLPTTERRPPTLKRSSQPL